MKSFSCSVCALFFFFLFSADAQGQTETLEQAWIAAYRHNPSLEAERARLRALDEQVSIALSNWRPNIDFTAGAGKTYQEIPPQRGFAGTNYNSGTVNYGVEVTQPLFRGFRTLAETKAAKKQVLAGRAQLQVAEQQLLLDTAKAFLSVIRDETLLAANRNNEAVLRKKLDETVTRAGQGDLTRTDVDQARSRLARAQVATARTRSALMDDRAAFRRIVGHEPGSLAKPLLSSEGLLDVEGLSHLAEKYNPSVIAALHTYEQSDAEIDAGKGSLLPELNLVGNASHNYAETYTSPGRTNTAQVMLQLKVPLYESGADYARIRAAQQTGVRYRMELQETRNRSQEILRGAWSAFQAANANRQAANIEMDAASQALKGVRLEARLGTRTTLDELNAEQELLDARTDLARAEHDRDVALLQIRQATGQLTADTLKLPIDAYDPRKHYSEVNSLWIGFGGEEDDIYAAVGQPLKDFGAYDDL